MPTVDENFLENNSKMLSFFGGVFDGFDLGRYLFGMDPRNKRGFSIKREFDPTVYLNARELNFTTKIDREFPFVVDPKTSKEFPIFALHIHSKDKNLFKSNKIRNVIKKAVYESKQVPKRKFYIKIFCTSLRLAAFRRFVGLIKIIWTRKQIG